MEINKVTRQSNSTNVFEEKRGIKRAHDNQYSGCKSKRFSKFCPTSEKEFNDDCGINIITCSNDGKNNISNTKLFQILSKNRLSEYVPQTETTPKLHRIYKSKDQEQNPAKPFRFMGGLGGAQDADNNNNNNNSFSECSEQIHAPLVDNNNNVFDIEEEIRSLESTPTEKNSFKQKGASN